MSCFITYKENASDLQEVQKREQYFAINFNEKKPEKEESIDDIDQTLYCSEFVTENCINLMENQNSPLEILKLHFGENTPIFDEIFLEAFINYFNISLEKDLGLTYYIINGPVENATRLIVLDFFNTLFTDLPINFDIILHLLSKTTTKGQIKFIEAGGIYVLCYFISDPGCVLVISQILLIISELNTNFFNEILPPNAFYPIDCNFDTTHIFTFKDFIKELFSFEDLEILELLIKSLKNLFKSDKAIQKLGNLVFKQLFIKKQFLFEDESQSIIPDLIELFNILSDQFDFDIFRLDLIDHFYSSIETNNYNHKVTLIPSFLSLIDNIQTSMLPPILEANTLQILEDMIYIENNTPFLPNIIEIVSDIASQIVMCKEDDQYDEYLNECLGILYFLSDHDDHKIANLARSAAIAIEDENEDSYDQECDNI